MHEADREAMLFALLSRSFTKRCIVFVQTKWHAHRLRLLCGLFGLRASELHGNLTQLQRLESLQQFKDEEVAASDHRRWVDCLSAWAFGSVASAWFGS